jgi:hypothetical protein
MPLASLFDVWSFGKEASVSIAEAIFSLTAVLVSLSPVITIYE